MIVVGFTGSQHWAPISRLKLLLIRDGRGCGDEGEAVQSRNNRKKRNNRKALWQGPGSPSRDKHNNTFELFCR